MAVQTTEIRHSSVGRLLAVLASAMLICGCGGDIDSEYADVEAGLTSLRQGKHKTAARLLRKGVKRHPENSTAQCNLGIAYWFLRQPEQAVAPLKAAAELVPYDSRPLEFLGLVLIDLNRWDEARSAVEEALACPSRSPRVLTLMGLVEFRAGELDRARDFFEQALALKRDYPPALYNMAILSRDTSGDPEEAYEYFDKYLRTVGERVEGSEIAALRVDTARDFLAASEKAAEEPGPEPEEEAVAEQKDVAAEESESERAEQPESVPDPVVVKAREALEDDDVAGALITLRRGIKDDPDNPELLWALALIYDNDLGHADKAEETYAMFRERFPGDPRSGGQAEAAAVDQGVEAAPAQDLGAARRAFAEGITCYRAKDLSGAIHYYKRAVELDTNYVYAAYNLGLVYKDFGELDLARESFLRALELNPRLIGANYMLGVLCWDLNDNAQAIVHINRALEIKPDYAKAHYLLGVIYRKEERFDMAKIHFRRCVELEPDEEWSNRARKWLKVQAAR
jgi:Tfp pilus assembly protein PilF